MNDRSTAGKVGKNTKKRSQMKSANENDSDVVQPKRSSGRQTSSRSREDSSTRRIQSQGYSDNGSSSDIALGSEHNRSATYRKQSFTNLREDCMTYVGEMVQGAETNFNNT